MSGVVNVIPTLGKFRGGPVRALLGGGSLEGGPVKKKHPVLTGQHLANSGGGQLKKTPCMYFFNESV